MSGRKRPLTAVESDVSDDEEGLINMGFVCPITQEVFREPHVAADGHTYERTAILKWLSKSRMSPVTGQPLAHHSITPNHTLRSAIIRYQENRNSGHRGTTDYQQKFQKERERSEAKSRELSRLRALLSREELELAGFRIETKRLEAKLAAAVKEHAKKERLWEETRALKCSEIDRLRAKLTELRLAKQLLKGSPSPLPAPLPRSTSVASQRTLIDRLPSRDSIRDDYEVKPKSRLLLSRPIPSRDGDERLQSEAKRERLAACMTRLESVLFGSTPAAAARQEPPARHVLRHSPAVAPTSQPSRVWGRGGYTPQPSYF